MKTEASRPSTRVRALIGVALAPAVLILAAILLAAVAPMQDARDASVDPSHQTTVEPSR